MAAQHVRLRRSLSHRGSRQQAIPPSTSQLATITKPRAMSYDQLLNLESGRRGSAGGYTDDPAFRDLQYDLKNQLQTLLSSNRKLANDVNVLGSKKDTTRLRERVNTTMEKTREICRVIGEGVKNLQTWEDLSVGDLLGPEGSQQD